MISRLGGLMFAAAVVAGSGATAAQSGSGNAPMEFAGAATPSDKVAFCDTVRFLSEGPGLNADVIIAPRDTRIPERLRQPYFVAGGVLYAQGYDRLFERLRSRRLATRDQLARSQEKIGRPLIDAYRRAHRLAPEFARTQLQACRDWGRGYGVDPELQ